MTAIADLINRHARDRTATELANASGWLLSPDRVRLLRHGNTGGEPLTERDIAGLAVALDVPHAAVRAAATEDGVPPGPADPERLDDVRQMAHEDATAMLHRASDLGGPEGVAIAVRAIQAAVAAAVTDEVRPLLNQEITRG